MKTPSEKIRSIAVLVLTIIFCAGCWVVRVKKACLGDACVVAEVADNPAAHRKGLMFRKSMPEDKGMLFIFRQAGPYGFWMKNTRFPLDIIWIDAQKKIVDIYPNAIPCKDVCNTYAPSASALYVLEVNGGFTLKHRVRIGDVVRF